MRNYRMGIASLLAAMCITASCSAAQKLVDTDHNGYKTYIEDTSVDLLPADGYDLAFQVEVIGYRPDGSIIMDVHNYFRQKGNKVYVRLQGQSNWRELFASAKQVYDAAYPIAREKAGK